MRKFLVSIDEYERSLQFAAIFEGLSGRTYFALQLEVGSRGESSFWEKTVLLCFRALRGLRGLWISL